MIESLSRYTNGIRDGYWRKFCSNGHLTEERYYDDGKLSSEPKRTYCYGRSCRYNEPCECGTESTECKSILLNNAKILQKKNITKKNITRRKR